MIKSFLLPPFLLTLSLLMKHNFILLIPYYRNHFTHSISSNLSNRTNKLLPMCQTSSVLQLLPLPHTYQHFTLLNHNYNYRYTVTEIILHVLKDFVYASQERWRDRTCRTTTRCWTPSMTTRSDWSSLWEPHLPDTFSIPIWSWPISHWVRRWCTQECTHKVVRTYFVSICMCSYDLIST